MGFGLDSFIGQEQVRKRVTMHIYHSILKRKALPHMLFTGSAGLGKTTLARHMAGEMCNPFYEIPASTLTAKKIMTLLEDITPESIIFIDEIHGMKMKVGELIYSVMQDSKLGNKKIPPVTIAGATTHEGLLEKPLRDRFTVRLKFTHYSPEEIQQMLMLKGIDPLPAMEMAVRAQGVPRIAVNTIFAEVMAVASLEGREPNLTDVMDACDLIGIDSKGFNVDDIRILKYLADRGKACSLKTISRALSIESVTLEYVHERWLIEKDMIAISSKGREITKKGRAYIGR